MPEKNYVVPDFCELGLSGISMWSRTSNAGTSQHFNAVPDLSKAGTT